MIPATASPEEAAMAQPHTARPRRAKLDAWELAALERLVELELAEPRTSIHRPGLKSALAKLRDATGPAPDFLKP